MQPGSNPSPQIQTPSLKERALAELRLAGKMFPSSDEILAQIEAIGKLQEAQCLYLERRAREKFLDDYREKLCLSEADRLELAAFTALFRELVETERAKFLIAHPQALCGVSAKTRTTLYPDKIPKPGADPSFAGVLRLGSSTFGIRAWAGKNFINMEFCLEPGATKTL